MGLALVRELRSDARRSNVAPARNIIAADSYLVLRTTKRSLRCGGTVTEDAQLPGVAVPIG